jgi:hypothetical protein
VYFRPPAASFSKFGVWHGPPNADGEPKPASSINTISTFGAPVGGRSGRIGEYLVSGSLASKVVRPIGVTSGIGSTCRWTVSCPFSALLLMEVSFVPVAGVLAIASSSCFAYCLNARAIRRFRRRSVSVNVMASPAA